MTKTEVVIVTKFMIAAAHMQALAENAYRYGHVYGMGNRGFAE